MYVAYTVYEILQYRLIVILPVYTLCFIKNTPLGFLLYLSQMLLNDSENWNKYSTVK